MNYNIICITPISHINDAYENLMECGDIPYIPDIKKEELIHKLKNSNHNVIFTNPNRQNYIIDSKVLENSNIKFIITASTGLNHIDLDYCKKSKITIYSLTKEFDTIKKITSTAEHCFGLLLSLIRNIPQSHYDVVKNQNWDYTKYIGTQLNTLTIGIIGYGRLGQMVEKYAKAFGMNVLIYDPLKNFNNLNVLHKNCDILTFHIHPDVNTTGMVTKEYIEKFEKNLYVINTSRGEIVDEESLIECLKIGKLYGYATDVIKDEFGSIIESNLVKNATKYNIIITPHIGDMTTQAQEIAYNGIINKFKAEK